jgi:hypothetical protein
VPTVIGSGISLRALDRMRATSTLPKKTCKLIIDGGNDYAVSEAMPLGLSPSKQIKKTYIAKFDIIRIIPNQQVGISQLKKLETGLQGAL